MAIPQRRDRRELPRRKQQVDLVSGAGVDRFVCQSGRNSSTAV